MLTPKETLNVSALMNLTVLLLLTLCVGVMVKLTSTTV